MKKLLIVGLVLVLGLALLAGCSQPKPTPAPDKPPTGDKPPDTPATDVPDEPPVGENKLPYLHGVLILGAESKDAKDEDLKDFPEMKFSEKVEIIALAVENGVHG